MRLDQLKLKVEGIDSAHLYVLEMRKRLDQPITEEVKRDLVHRLVDQIVINMEEGEEGENPGRC